MSDAGPVFPRTIYDWSERLLEYYFSKRTGDEPVVRLVVSPRQLAEAAGVPVGYGVAGRDDLLGKLRNASKRLGLFGHAAQFVEERNGSAPAYLPHLILSCLAATGQYDGGGPDSEGGYIRELADLSGRSESELHLDELKRLWPALKTWLDNHSSDYRTLVLPDPGGWRRIGYSVKLAFPPSRDLETLSRVLADNGLDFAEPPL